MNTFFTDQSTVVVSAWLNDINNVVYNLLGNGTIVPTTTATLRTNLGLGTMATQNANAVAITGGTMSGVAISGVATSGANSNITSLTGLTTPITGVGDNSKIQPITASVAGNALTLTLNPTSLDFRSSTLGSGAVVTRVASVAVSMVVPSGATLGTLSGNSERLAILAIDNAGTIEVAVVNTSGGVNLDETSVISTTTVSGGSSSGSIVYSTTARSNVAFRVVGFINATEATAGTWATAPSLIQGSGGLSTAGWNSIGYGQSWSNPTRSIATVYYNTTGRPILALVSLYSTATAAFTMTVNGITVQRTQPPANQTGALGAIIPPGASYSVTSTGGTTTLDVWGELR